MILAFTGAGISKASGIPTFAEQGDMRTKLDRMYYRMHKDEVDTILDNMLDMCVKADPNDAHKALAEYKVPIITMNVDGLHQAAGSEHVLPIHGSLPDIVMYGDPAPKYQDAFDWVFRLKPSDIFLIIGVSFYTNISDQLKICAQAQGARVVIINKNSEEYVRAFIENNKKSLGDFDEFINREPDF